MGHLNLPSNSPQPTSCTDCHTSPCSACGRVIQVDLCHTIVTKIAPQLSGLGTPQRERNNGVCQKHQQQNPLKRCVPKTLAFAFGLRLCSKTRCFKTRVLGSLVAVSKSVFQRKIPRLNPEVYRLSSHPTFAQLHMLDFPPLLSLKPLPTSRVTQRRSSRGFVPTPNPSLAQEPLKSVEDSL